ncbi:hypothetical protein MNBD_NITROSPINAE01-1267 [hydrothermal vent metagenome]|uniref:OmpA-like domain-containing protein n=1 Tax=hydrothermal vent metagenome TaxID=652676 RepID=A0A3B1CQI1_9ZZZZ
MFGPVKKFLFLSVIFLFVSQASAQTAIDGGSGLFYVQKAKTLGDKSFAIGAIYDRGDYHNGSDRTDADTLSIPATLGIGERFEVSVFAPFRNIDPSMGNDQSGISDGLARVKWNFYNWDKYNINAAVMALVTLPFGDENKGLGTGKTNLGIGLALDKEYENVSWHFNVGFLSRNEDAMEDQTLYGAGVEWRPSAAPLGLIAEFSGAAYTVKKHGLDDNSTGILGARYYFGDWGSAQIGYGARTSGTGAKSPNYMLMAGITVGIGLNKKKHEPSVSHEALREESAPPATPVIEKAEPVQSAPAPVVREPAPAPVVTKTPAPAPMVSVALESVHFKFDSAKLTGKAQTILKRNAAKLQENQKIKVILEGNTCSIGTEEYNLKLGKRRARSVKLYMVKKLGVERDSMFVVVSHGESTPVSSNKTEEGRKQNRRVDFVIQK